MDFENFKEGQPIQNLPLFEKENFLEWKSKFENYVKSIDQDLWHIISIGDYKSTKTSFENQNDYPKLDKTTKAKIIIFKALPSTEYERMYFCQTANDIWKSMLNFHQEVCQVKDDHFDLTYELEVLERHLVEISTCATSLNVLNEGVSEDDYSCRALSGLAYDSWINTDEDEANHLVCDSQLDKISSKVHFETKHFCFDTFILEFSKLENESKLSCNMDLKNYL